MKICKSLIAAATAFVIAAPMSAHADVSLCLDDGAGGLAALCVNDGGAGDWNSALGAITYIGSYGGFVINVSTALGEPFYLNGYGMDLNSINSGVGTLVVSMSQTDMHLGTGGPISLASGIGGTTGGTVNYAVYADDGNTLFGQGTKVFDGSSNGWVFAGGGGDTFNSVDGTFSLSHFVTITHKSLATTSFDLESKVPEPASLSLVGLALLGVGAAGRRKAAR